MILSSKLGYLCQISIALIRSNKTLVYPKASPSKRGHMSITFHLLSRKATLAMIALSRPFFFHTNLSQVI